DLQAYRSLLLKSDKDSPKAPAPPKPKKPSRDELQALRSELRKSEARVEKLHDMHAKLSEKLADPDLYEAERLPDLEVWQKKFAEVEEAIDRAEALWMQAQEQLDAAEARL
ncbi:MAG: ABC transporter ATP-binding protein, partial [Rhodobacteraceae bacterium]|nr:ABC transporter ATP-binding protein [Paracoccaceae bacterium]